MQGGRPDRIRDGTAFGVARHSGWHGTCGFAEEINPCEPARSRLRRERCDAWVAPRTELAGASLVDDLDHPGQHVRIGVRGDAVTEVEDVSGQLATLGHNLAHPRLEHRPRRKEQSRVEVALHGIRVPKAG